MTDVTFDHRTIGHVLAAQAEANPSRVILRQGSRSVTFAQAFFAAHRIAGGLSKLGVQPQEPVAVMLDNDIDFALTWLGLGCLGAIEVPVNTAYKGSVLTHVLADSAARVAIVDAPYVARLEDVASRVPRLDTVVVRGDCEVAVAGATRVVGFEHLVTCEAKDPGDVGPWDVAAIMYTSGTTGISKGVVVPHGHAFASAAAFLDIDGHDNEFVTLPMFHIGGMWAGVYRSLIAGACATIAPQFSVRSFWSDVRRYECTSTLVLGAMADFLLRQPPRADDLVNPLRQVLMVPASGRLDEFGSRFGVEVNGGYGLTEAGTITRAGPESVRPGSCGWAREDIDIRLVDDHDAPVPPGEVGEMIVRARDPWTFMLGYHDMAQATMEACRNGWLHTGDAFYEAGDGQYCFVDRKKDCIRRRGENVSSVEVESELLARAEVAEAAVVAVASEHTEDEIKAVLVLHPGWTLNLEDLVLDLTERMPYFMVPRYFEIVDSLPMTATQKVMKAVLREEGVTSSTWDRESRGIRVTRSGIRIADDD